MSVVLVDWSKIIQLVPVEAGTEIPTITPAFRVLSLIQPSIILAVAVLLGIKLAPKAGLSAPLAEAVASQSDLAAAIKPQVIPGVVGGLLGTLCIVSVTAVFKPYMSSETIERIGQFTTLMPIPTRLLYGGITEELLLRWGFMTLLVWLMWRVLQRGRATPKKSYFVAAILLSSFVFGLGHLPVAFMLLPEATLAVVLFVITANSAFGLIAGYLYWKRGLESAMIAHMFGHLVMACASYARLYF